MTSGRPRFEQIRPIADDCAQLPIGSAFDWSAVTSEADHGEWYVVTFRSVRRPDADEARLTALDDVAHAEAAGMPGFIHYYKGPTNDHGDCLSFCIWESREAARAASRLPGHVVASAVAGEMYESYRLDCLRLIKHAGRPDFVFEPFDRASAGRPGGNPARGANPKVTRSRLGRPAGSDLAEDRLRDAFEHVGRQR